MFDDFIRMIGDAFGSLLGHAQQVLTGNAVGVDAVWGAIENLGGGIIMTVATQILVICMLLELVQVAQRFDTVTFEMGAKVMAKLVLAKMAIEQGPNLLRGIFQTSNGMLAAISGVTPGSLLSRTHAGWMEVVDNFNSMGLLDKFQAILPMIIMGLALLVCGVSMVIVAYARVFEVLVFAAISPIPIAFLPIGQGDGSGFSSIAMGFFKGFAAVCLQGVLMMACIQIFMQLSISISFTAATEGFDFGGMMSLIIVSIVLATSVKKSGEWARQILGAGA